MINAILFLEPKGTIFEVVKAAKEQGLYTIALVNDKKRFLDEPEPYLTSTKNIDKVILIPSWSDKESILEITTDLEANYKIVGVYSGIDTTMSITSTLRTKYNLPTSSEKTIDLILNKLELRKLLNKKGLSNIIAISRQDFKQMSPKEICYPIYFKPIRGCASAYVSKCHNIEDVNKAKTAFEKKVISLPNFFDKFIHDNNDWYIEEAFKGELLSVEAIMDRGKFYFLGLLSRILYSKNSVIEMGSCFPYPHPMEKDIVEKVKRVHEEIGFFHGPTHTEVIVSSSGEIEVIDFNPRFVGADVLQSINFAYNTKTEKYLLDNCMGRPFTPPNKIIGYSCLQYILAPKADKFQDIQLPNKNEVKFTATFMKYGTPLLGKDAQVDYLGCYLTVMPTFESALKRSKELRSYVKINNNLKGVF